MDFVSTRGGAPPTDLPGAVFRGLAPDGGLYMPRTIPRLDPGTLAHWADLSWPDLAVEVLQALLGGALEPDVLSALVRDALDFPVPLVRLGEDRFVLELFRGPTLAFKDVGARFLARLVGHLRSPDDPVTTILTATSGDTGGAVAQGFHGVDGTRVVVLFPEGQVTPRQERQFSTLGGNVTAVAVHGDFDDCQRLAKEAFQAQAGKAPGRFCPGQTLTSANSINIGRFLPQVTYFFQIAAALRCHEINRTKILISVPSGNFGNLAAGLTARAMGWEGPHFLAATNRNDAVPRFLRTGSYDPRASVRTLSTAMDVGDPSNLDRILHLHGGNLDRLRKALTGHMVTDPRTRECIARVHQETGYVLDPHSAVAYGALEAEGSRHAHRTRVLLATAHPAKFAEVVEPILGVSLPIPQELARCMEAPPSVVPMEPRIEALREVLRR